ncbi:MAG: hypothetical protein HRT73_07135 [Flavobacteriales bacterium]|nr:hypothetical protein [Flavobacteriales bacterium]
MNDVYLIITGAFIGAIFTLITQSMSVFIKRNRIKKAVIIYLNEIEGMSYKMKKEIPQIRAAILNKNQSKDIQINMFAGFNANILKSFSMEELQSVFKKDLKHIIEIIGDLENLELRLPYIQFNKYVKDSSEHITEHFEKQKDIYKTKDDHFNRCPQVNSLKQRASKNLKHVENTLTELQENILIIKGEWKG